MSDERYTPPTRRNGWIIVYVFFAVLATAGVTLSLLYRDSSKPGEAINKERRKAARFVTYVIVFSKIDEQRADAIIADIVRDVGADTAVTDYVIGSPITDPWCATIGEYQRNLKKAMTQAKPMVIGKQSVVVSMVAGLLIKNQLPARIYFVGSLAGDDITSIAPRTANTAAAFELRSNVQGPISVISYLEPASSPANSAYWTMFQGKSFATEQRTK
jgi:hypothetical protein